MGIDWWSSRQPASASSNTFSDFLASFQQKSNQSKNSGGYSIGGVFPWSLLLLYIGYPLLSLLVVLCSTLLLFLSSALQKYFWNIFTKHTLNASLSLSSLVSLSTKPKEKVIASSSSTKMSPTLRQYRMLHTAGYKEVMAAIEGEGSGLMVPSVIVEHYRRGVKDLKASIMVKLSAGER